MYCYTLDKWDFKFEATEDILLILYNICNYKNYNMNFPANLKYTKDHEWILLEGNTATIGITDFAQGELGDIVFVDIPTLGKNLQAEAIFGTVEAVKTVSDLFMPVAGEVLEFNADLEGAPESVNKDPYNSGWMVKVRMSDPSQVAGLLSADDYRKLIGA